MQYKVISKRSLRVRRYASSKSKTIKFLKRGAIVDVGNIANGWAYLPDYKGYVAARLIKKIGDATAQSVPSTTTTINADPTPVETPTTNSQKIAQWATNMAYTTNTSSAKYPSGSPTTAYYNGFRQAFSSSERSRWSWAAHRVGANCGGFVGACVRLSGVDSSFPHTAAAAFSHLDNTKKFKRITPSVANLRDGDIIDYRNSGGGCHICIYVGGKIKEASAGEFYPKTTSSVAARISSKGKSKLRVYRAL